MWKHLPILATGLVCLGAQTPAAPVCEGTVIRVEAEGGKRFVWFQAESKAGGCVGKFPLAGAAIDALLRLNVEY